VTGLNSNLTIQNCSFSSNKAVLPEGFNLSIYGGGAVTIIGANATAVISDTDFKQNSASSGAAILSHLGSVVLLQKVSWRGTS
jgi:hypothetical protein